MNCIICGRVSPGVTPLTLRIPLYSASPRSDLRQVPPTDEHPWCGRHECIDAMKATFLLADPGADILVADLAYDCHAIVIPVNTLGVAGAGLAKAARLKFRTHNDNWFAHYHASCEAGRLDIGKVAAWRAGTFPIVVSLATKKDWRGPSRFEYVAPGLSDLRRWLGTTSYRVAIPALGCGLGGLRWDEVRPLIERVLVTTNTVFVLYPPQEG